MFSLEDFEYKSDKIWVMPKSQKFSILVYELYLVEAFIRKNRESQVFYQIGLDSCFVKSF